MSDSRFPAAAVVIAPAVLALGFIYHPYVVRGTDEVALAEAAASDPARWGISHLMIGVGYALLALAFIAVRARLRDAGEDRWSRQALPFAVLGSALFPILTGMEFALVAAEEIGADGAAAQSELMPWFVPILLIGGLSFAIGAVCFALALVRSGFPSGGSARVAAVALVVMGVVRFVPLGAAQIVIGVAAIVAFWPLAAGMLRQPSRVS